MRKRIRAYLEYIDKILSHDLPVVAGFDENREYEYPPQKDVIPTRKEYERILVHHLEQIAFFQHERLVHLLVTILFALLTFGCLFICLLNFHPMLLLLFVALLVLLIPYIAHYYILENGVQKMYRQYDELIKKML